MKWVENLVQTGENIIQGFGRKILKDHLEDLSVDGEY
jgi:hypothetical protein